MEEFESEILGTCTEDYLQNGKLRLVNYAGHGNLLLECLCDDLFPTTVDSLCSVSWNYFCRDNYILAFGQKLLITSQITYSGSSIYESIYGKPTNELPIVCVGELNGHIERRGFLLQSPESTQFEVLEDGDFASGAVTGVQYGLAILILTFVCLFMIKRFLTTIRLWNRDRKNKNEDDGKTIDIFLCGAVDDSDLMNQLKLDFTNFGYITKVTTQSLIRQNELSDEFMNNAGHVRCLIYVFSAETVTKMNKKIKNKSLSYDLQHEWFNDWFDKGIEKINKTCKQNGIKSIIITVYKNRLEGQKSDPTPLEQKIKDKIENGLKVADQNDFPIVEFSREYQKGLQFKEKNEKSNPYGLYDVDGEYRKSVDKLRLHLHRPVNKKKTPRKPEPDHEMNCIVKHENEKLVE